jgi:hypothetical protein
MSASRASRVSRERCEGIWFARRRFPPDPAAFGDAWLASRRSAVLRVPSVIGPESRNLLVDVAHPDAERAGVASIRPDDRPRRPSDGRGRTRPQTAATFAARPCSCLHCGCRRDRALRRRRVRPRRRRGSRRRSRPRHERISRRRRPRRAPAPLPTLMPVLSAVRNVKQDAQLASIYKIDSLVLTEIKMCEVSKRSVFIGRMKLKAYLSG